MGPGQLGTIFLSLNPGAKVLQVRQKHIISVWRVSSSCADREQFAQLFDSSWLSSYFVDLNTMKFKSDLLCLDARTNSAKQDFERQYSLSFEQFLFQATGPQEQIPAIPEKYCPSSAAGGKQKWRMFLHSGRVIYLIVPSQWQEKGLEDRGRLWREAQGLTTSEG